MEKALRSKLSIAFARLPDGCRESAATEAELVAFETEFGSIPEDYRWFLAECGGGTIGSEWLDGIVELEATHRKFLAESDSDNGWALPGVFVIGWDGSGNPFGIQRETGKVLVADHDAGGVYEMATSFEAFLVAGLLP